MASALPLLLKELRSISRDRRTYALRSAFAAAGALLVYGAWTTSSLRPRAAVSELAEIGRSIYGWTVAVQTAFALVSAAGLAVDSIGREIRRGTLPLLLLASLDGRRIVRAKWLSSVAQAVLVPLCAIPLLAMSAFLGAAGAGEVAAAVLLSFAAAAVGAAYGIDASVRTPAGGSALFRSLSGLFVYGALGFATAVVSLGLASYILPFVHVYAAFLVVLFPGSTPIPPLPAASTTLAFSLAFGLWKIRRAEKLVALSLHLPVLPSETPRDLVGLDGLYARRRGRGVWDDAPILWKELNTRPIARVALLGRIFGLVTLALLVLLSLPIAEIHGAGYFVMLWTILLLLFTAGGAVLFETERAQSQWDSLLMTPISRAGFVLLKLRAGLLSPEALCLWGLAGLSVVIWGHFGGPGPFAALGLATASSLVLAYLSGAAACLWTRSLAAGWILGTAATASWAWALPGWSTGALMEACFAGMRRDARPEVLLRHLAATLLLQLLLAAACFGLSLRRLRECPPRA